MELTKDILEQLGAPFPEGEIGFLPRGNWDGKAKALAYIDARSVMNRLDAVVGPANWSFTFDMLTLDGKMVRGSLTVCGVTKSDAGEAGSEDEVLKAAVSDSLKRVAVQFGIGRYLYYLDGAWYPFDLRKRQFTETPRIPADQVARALATCGIPNTGGRPSQPATRTQPQSSQRPTAAEKAEGTMRGQEQPASSMVAGGTTGKPPATPGMGALEPKPEGRSIWTAGAGGHGDTGRQPESSGDAQAQGGDAALLACSVGTCGKPLTRGQHDVSVRAFGQPLCPACQRTQARGAA